MCIRDRVGGSSPLVPTSKRDLARNETYGAVFLDAGNVWLMREDEYRPSGEFTLKKFPRQIALGTGFGLRYDLDFLVFRLDSCKDDHTTSCCPSLTGVGA